MLTGEGGGCGGGAKSYDRKKAWSSINYSKLSESDHRANNFTSSDVCVFDANSEGIPHYGSYKAKPKLYSRPRKSPRYESGSIGESADGNWMAGGRRGALDLETYV